MLGSFKRFWAVPKYSVLMVCTANICRSPLAHGMLLHKLKQAGLHKLVRVDSAGTHVAKARYRPDLRGQKVAQLHGFDISRQRARQLQSDDFKSFDEILVMDGANLKAMEATFPNADMLRVKRILSYTEGYPEADVPDPYFGSADGFERVYELLLPAIEACVDECKQRLLNEE